MKARIVAAVCAAWLLIGVVLGSQTALGMTMQGSPVPLAAAVRTAWINNLPWIPATLIAIALASRYPVDRTTWSRHLWIHLAAIPVVAWIANLGVVVGFGWSSGSLTGPVALARQAAFWATIRVHVAATIYGATLVLTQGWLSLRAARARELRVARLETQLAHARFRALSAQIRPHFLFNTLHTIGQLWRSGRADDADAMLDHLGALFQKVRASTDRPGIALDQELEMVEEYLAIEQTRFRDRLVVRVTATDAARECVVPPLLLQPIVENAVRHGASASASAGRVEVDARVERGRLRIEILDDGPGFECESASPGTGTGLSNTRERLEHAFGADQALELQRTPEGRTRVRIDIPASSDLDRWDDDRAGLGPTGAIGLRNGDPREDRAVDP